MGIHNIIMRMLGNGGLLPKRWGLFLAILLMVAIAPGAQAKMSCSIKQSCASGESDLFHIYSLSNSHAQLASQSGYPNRVCCGAVPGLTTSCTQTNSKVLLRLSDLTNAHVENNSFSNYQHPVCLYTPEGNMECGYSPDCSSLGSDYACVAGISNGWNAHVSDCTGQGIYSLKVCCRFVDTGAPVTAISPNGMTMTGQDVTFSLTCTDTGSSCKATYYKIVDGTICGTGFSTGNSGTVSCDSGSTCSKTVCYYSEDAAGNKDNVKSALFNIDKQPPVTEDDSDTEWHGSDVTVTFKCTDSVGGSGCGSTYYCVYDDGGTQCTPSTPGSSVTISCAGKCQKIVRYYSKDSVGNSETTHSSKTVMIDKDLPACTISPLQSYTNKTKFSLSWTASSLGAPITLVTIERNDSGSWQTETTSQQASGSYDFTGIAGTTYGFRCKANNTLGKAGYSTVVKTMIDAARPSCTFGDLPTYQPSGSFQVSWTGFDAHSGVKEFIVERLGDDWIQIYRGSLGSYSIPNLADGSYGFRCRAIDNANNMGDYSEVKHTTVDTSPPSIIGPAFNSSVFKKENMTIRASITDGMEVKEASLYFNDAVVVPFIWDRTNPKTWNMTWVITTPNAEGNYKFTIRASDLTGKNLSREYEFNVVFCVNGDTRPCGACGSGTRTCVNGNWTVECIGENKGLAKAEVCNGKDDDCNGIIDDVKGGKSIQETQCGCYLIGEIGKQDETCNSIDDDCDGEMNEDAGCCNPGETRPCARNQGICEGAVHRCENGKFGACSILPSKKDCGSSLDNDCNGLVDSQEPSCKISCTDSDSDGYGYPASSLCTYQEEDCDDSDPDVYPGAPPTCESLKDNNCDGSTTEEEAACETDTCHNGEQDGNEEGVDCGGDCPACIVWGWLFITAGGVVILLILVVVWMHLRRQGREMTWSELKNKWNPE
jgi:hypothetical protein